MSCQSCSNTDTDGVIPKYSDEVVQGRSVTIPVPKPLAAPVKLPLAFHIPKLFTQVGPYDQPLDMWLAFHHVATLYYEINRIWGGTGIRFTFAGCYTNHETPTQQQLQALFTLQNAGRNQTREEDLARKSAIKTLSDGLGRNIKNSFNVHFVPYMGMARQGNSVGSDTTVCCGVWTDKPSQGMGAPVKTPLTEIGPFVHGSLGRTIAHELGHCMGLQHNRRWMKLPNIMGNPSGYGFTSSQIRTAVIEANRHLREFQYKP